MKTKLALGSFLLASLALSSTLPANKDPYLAMVHSTAQWLAATAVPSKDGTIWPADPRDPKSTNTTLYAGTPGPILFFLEAYRYTGSKSDLQQARKGADALLASISSASKEETGLYEGIAGTGFTLGEAYLVTKDPKYRAGALRCVQLLKSAAKPAGKGMQWSDTTDIIAGNSGTGLFLLWADKNLHAVGARALAIQAGERLLEVAKPTPDGGLKWMMDPRFPREMPNFSHGTAGVAYFLATLYQETHQKEFLDASLAGAHYLLSIADKDRAICMIYHDNERKNLYYLGWCHGPSGTARLFYRLYQITHDQTWLDWMKKSAEAIVASGGPEKVVVPGEWDNVSMCCGVASQAEFFLNMYSVTHDRRYLDLSKQASDRLLSLATSDGKGARWVQVENRIQPDVAVAQTGYMQGASGIGMWLLHLHAELSGEHKPAITFPDNPFTY